MEVCELDCGFHAKALDGGRKSRDKRITWR